MSYGSVFVLLCLMISCHGWRDFDITPIGFRVTNSSVRVYFQRRTFRSFSRSTMCDGEVNGKRLETWRYTTSFSTGYYDGCTISIPSSARPVKTFKVIVNSLYDDFEIKNGTRWDFDFDMTRVPVPVKVMFGKANSYIIQRKKVLKNRKMSVNGLFRMKLKGARPLYTSFRFDGVNLSALSTENANVRLFANGAFIFNDKVFINNTIRKRYILSKVKIDESLARAIGGTRGFMFFGATFQVTPYLKLTGSINIGFDVYTLYNGFYLFPYGSFAMLEPPRNNSVITLKRNQYNIIPCLTIGASQFGFEYTPKLSKLNSDGSLSNSTFSFRRRILGLFYREDSPVVIGDLAGVEGTYECKLTYDVLIDEKKGETINQTHIQRNGRKLKDLNFTIVLFTLINEIY